MQYHKKKLKVKKPSTHDEELINSERTTSNAKPWQGLWDLLEGDTFNMFHNLKFKSRLLFCRDFFLWQPSKSDTTWLLNIPSALTTILLISSFISFISVFVLSIFLFIERRIIMTTNDMITKTPIITPPTTPYRTILLFPMVEDSYRKYPTGSLMFPTITCIW